MKKILLVLCLAVLLSGHKLYAQSGVFVPELSVVDVHVSQFMQKWALPGGSVAIVKDGRLVYARGFGEADKNTPVMPDNLFRIASLSKPITAMAIMKLVEEGALQVDNLVFGEQGILNSPEYSTIKDERIKAITVKHLLQHTAGWDRVLNPEGDPMFNSVKIAREMQVKSPAGQQDIIQYVLRQPLDFYPGTHFSYSNIGYCILGRIIEKLTGLRYEDYVYQAMLQPLGIADMRLATNLYASKHEKEVRYYDSQGRPMVPSVLETGKKVSCQYGGYNVEAMDSHGGWIASPTDLARLMVASDGFRTKPDFLQVRSIDMMTTPSVQYPGYAMGWFVNNSGNWWHTGSLAGSSALMARLQNGLIWVVVFNGNPQSPAYFSALDQLLWKATGKVKMWPAHDLFNPAAIADRVPQ
jgi:CubicO group peptidase (beta-lactamase class C family)